MSRHEEATRQDAPRSRETVVGLVLNEDDLEDVGRVCLRALAYNLNILIVCSNEVARTLPDIVERPEITVVRTSPAGETERITKKDRLLTVARELAVSRVIFVTDMSSPVDFERTLNSPDRHSTENTPDIIESRPIRATETNCLVAIPAYNEEQTIRKVVESAQEYADKIVVIDDGSTDNTTREAWRGGADVVVHERNRGYGAALRTAFVVAAERGAETLITLDGDGQHDPRDVPKLVDALENEQANVVIGSRFVGEKTSSIPLYRQFGLLVINVLTNVSLARFRSDSWIHDTQSGFRAYDQETIELLSAIDSIGDNMGASLDILYQVSESGLTIAEHPVVVEYDVPGESTQHPVSHGFGLIQTILFTTVRRYGPGVILPPALLFAAFVFGVLSLTDTVVLSASSGLAMSIVAVLVGFLLLTATTLIYGQTWTSRS